MAPLDAKAPPSGDSSQLALYLPPSSPLFSYSTPGPQDPSAPNGGLTGSWRGAAGTVAPAGGTSGGWREKAASPPAESIVGNTKQTTGGAAVAVNNVHLTSFTPLFDPIPGYTPTLQSSASSPPTNWSANQTYTQPFGPSSLVFTVQCTDPAACPSTPFTFYGAQLGTEVSPPSAAGGTPQSAIADDASGLIQYTGWSAIGKDNAVVSAGAGDYAGTLSMTATGNASATVRFKGTAVLIRGVTAPPLGGYTVTLDANPIQTYNAQDDVTTHDVPLFFATALDGAVVHELALVTLAGGPGGTGAVLDRVEIWGPEGGVGFIGSDGKLVIPPESTIVPPGPAGGSGFSGDVGDKGIASGNILPGATSAGAPSAGAIVGILIGVIAGLVIVYYFFRKYGRPATAKPAQNSVNKWDAANNLQAMKQEAVLVTTVANQRYVYRMIAHSDLSAK